MKCDFVIARPRSFGEIALAPIMFEALFWILSEFVLQAVMEALVELGFHSLPEPFRKRPNPWLAAFGYAIMGAIAGALSLWAFPDHMVKGEVARILNVIVTPVAVGATMGLMGRWRTRRGQPALRIDHFAYGYLFALSLALIRFWFAH